MNSTGPSPLIASAAVWASIWCHGCRVAGTPFDRPWAPLIDTLRTRLASPASVPVCGEPIDDGSEVEVDDAAV
jgi:hypothetical protein